MRQTCVIHKFGRAVWERPTSSMRWSSLKWASHAQAATISMQYCIWYQMRTWGGQSGPQLFFATDAHHLARHLLKPRGRHRRLFKPP